MHYGQIEVITLRSCGFRAGVQERSCWTRTIDTSLHDKRVDSITIFVNELFPHRRCAGCVLPAGKKVHEAAAIIESNGNRQVQMDAVITASHKHTRAREKRLYLTRVRDFRTTRYSNYRATRTTCTHRTPLVLLSMRVYFYGLSIHSPSIRSN